VHGGTRFESIERERPTVREAYRDTLAQAKLTGGVQPSRAALADLLNEVPEAEDRVAKHAHALLRPRRRIIAPGGGDAHRNERRARSGRY